MNTSNQTNNKDISQVVQESVSNSKPNSCDNLYNLIKKYDSFEPVVTANKPDNKENIVSHLIIEYSTDGLTRELGRY